MGVGIARNKARVRLSVDGFASVRVVGEVRATLLEALESARTVEVDLSEASGADAAFAQLIASAARTFASAGVAFEVDDAGEVLRSAFPGATFVA